MNPSQDYKQLLSEVIKKQIVILGPDITLAKARNVAGLQVADDGSVLNLTGEPQQITQKLIDQFVQLSGEIVKKTMEPLLTMNQAQPTQPPAVPPANIIPQAVPQTSPQVPVNPEPAVQNPPPAPVEPPESQTPPPLPVTEAKPTLAQDEKSVQ